MQMDITARLVIKSTRGQWRVILRLYDELGQLGQDSVLASFNRQRPVAVYAMQSAVTAIQKLLGDRIKDGLTIETNKEGLSELSALGLMPDTKGL